MHNIVGVCVTCRYILTGLPSSDSWRHLHEIVPVLSTLLSEPFCQNGAPARFVCFLSVQVREPLPSLPSIQRCCFDARKANVWPFACKPVKQTRGGLLISDYRSRSEKMKHRCCYRWQPDNSVCHTASLSQTCRTQLIHTVKVDDWRYLWTNCTT